ncbi:AAA family ATPase [Klebsiella pneumoniae]|uniref:AAA family ATPase n=1 Tax=Klebsiella pneumoniae TaxID=573 RepID=UPI003EE3C0FB
MKSYLRIERLILVGVRKNYIVKFEDGLNIIHGDSDTGKSSILEFINYLLGASKIELADEIISSVNYAALEVIINDSAYTIVRDIYKPQNFIEVYQCLARYIYI